MNRDDLIQRRTELANALDEANATANQIKGALLEVSRCIKAIDEAQTGEKENVGNPA